MFARRRPPRLRAALLRPSLRSIAHRAANGPDTRRKVIFSGIQPTGVPHLGNYLGALQQWVKLQNDAALQDRLFFCVVDLHAITVKQDPDELARWTYEMAASLLAVGLDPERSIIFCQSKVPQHAELMWLLSTNASMGYLSRMTQWKTKLALPQTASPFDASPSSKAALKLGLFSYPVLQAADILLYRASHVPVGEDQAQHLEFTRELAHGFNHLYATGSAKPPNELLIPPKTILSPAKRVMSLTNPSKKMSKSDPDPKSRILITDTQDEINKKIKQAVTDSILGVSYDPQTRPGVSNLIEIMYYLDPSLADSPAALASSMQDLSLKALKEKVAHTINTHIMPIRQRYVDLTGTSEGRWRVYDALNRGRQKAAHYAEKHLRNVQRNMGLQDFDRWNTIMSQEGDRRPKAPSSPSRRVKKESPGNKQKFNKSVESQHNRVQQSPSLDDMVDEMMDELMPLLVAQDNSLSSRSPPSQQNRTASLEDEADQSGLPTKPSSADAKAQEKEEQNPEKEADRSGNGSPNK